MGKTFFKQIFCPQLILLICSKVECFCVFYTLTQLRTWDPNCSHAGDICCFKHKKISQTRRPNTQGVIYRLIEPLASIGHSSVWKLICAIGVCNTLTVGVHLSSTPSISGPGSATAEGVHKI